MAVESFLPTTDVKITVEKKVKEKPSIESLTTIESSGKPMPASNLEYKKKKKVRRKNKASTKNVKIEKTKKDSIFIITEKPQAAFKIASALGNARKYSENKVPFYELERGGEKIIVASAVGHLFNLTYSKGQTGWPIFKTEWTPAYTKKSAAFTKKYLNLLKKLTKRAKEIIIATDYDIEGEVIGWNVLRFITKKKNAKRMKYSTLTKSELEKSFENPLDSLDWGQAYAGETRHKIDWLYGINLSRALMSAIKKTGSFKLLSIGRVQGPALKIIVDKDKEIKNFKSKPYWQAIAHLDWTASKIKKPSGKYEFKHPKDIFDKKLLKEFENINEAEASTIKKEETIMPPHPFDLTSLQRESHKFHYISPSNTLKVAQKLYLDGLISYPRTSSQKIPKEIEPKKILKKLSENFKEIEFATRNNPVEGKKTDPAHPSIYPTGEFKNLDGNEKKIYELIVKRFISSFSENAQTINQRINLHAEKENKRFTTSGIKIIDKGWMNVYPVKIEEKSLPEINGNVKISKIEFPEKITKPPKRYTAASLITILEKKGLGTKATRSSIIDILFERGYLDGKSIQATPLGEKLIDALEKYAPIIIDENLTRNLEEKMEEILKTKSGFEEKEKIIIKRSEEIIMDISKDFKTKELEIGKEILKGLETSRLEEQEKNTLMDCPSCKKGKLRILYSRKTKRSFVACSAYPDCKQTYSLPPNSIIKKTEKLSEDGLPMLIAFRKGRKPWNFKFDPNWKLNQN